MQISDGGGSRTYVPHDLVPPQTGFVRPGETVRSFDEKSPRTPAERTDAAWDNYEKAVQHRDQALANAPKNGAARQEIKQTEDAAVAKASREVDAAVDAEIGARIYVQNAGVPLEYQTPADALITAYGNTILQRHAGDPAAQSFISGSINDYRVQRQADQLIPTFNSKASPKENLEALNRSLEGQPPEVVARVMADPSVQTVVQQAEDWVNEPYKGVSDPGAKNNSQAALESSQRLAEVTSLLPPQYAAQVVEQCMPTVKKIAGCDAYPLPMDIFGNMSRVVDSLGDSPQAQALTNAIVQAYRGPVELRPNAFTNPDTGIISYGIGNGASPKLALALAEQLQADGKTELAGNIVSAVAYGAKILQENVNRAYGDYAEATQELNWLITNSQGQLTPEQLQKAVDEYIASQPPEWQAQLREVEGTLVENASALNETIGELKNLPDSLKGLAPELGDALKSVGEDKTTQQSIVFAANKDPSIFSGPEGSSAAEFWIGFTGNSKDLVGAYLTGQVLPELSYLDPKDPASVTRANKQLDDLQANGAKLLGIPQSEVDAAVGQIKGILNTLQTAPSPEAAIAGVKQQLSDLGDMKFSSGIAAVAFRSVAFGLTGAGLINQTKSTMDDPSLMNVLGECAALLGLASDSASFATSVKLIDPKSQLGQFGLGTSEFAQKTGKFMGVLGIATYLYSGLEASGKGDLPGVIFNLAGTFGAVLPMVAEGAWAGPAGMAITFTAGLALQFANYVIDKNNNTEAAEKFLQDAGLNADVAKTLSTDALEAASILQEQLGLTPQQMQEIAKKHPGVLQSPGHANGLVVVAKACGIEGDDVPGFIDALAEDDPNYSQYFFDKRGDGLHPMTHQANLFDIVMRDMPTAASYIKQHAPEMVGSEANARRQADRDYESANGHGPQDIGSLLARNHNPAYQAEIIRIIDDSDLLDGFVWDVATSYHYNGYPEAAKSAIQAAENAGVLSHEDAQRYLKQLG